MATVSGAMTTTNVLADTLAIDLGDRINLLEPSAQPLAVFTRKAGKERTTRSKFSWLEEKSKARFMTQAGGATSGAASIALTTGQGAYVQQWDQVLNTRTGEQIRVDSVSGDTINVTRGIGSTAAAMNNLDELLIIGSAQPENDTSKPARSDVPSSLTNNTQIFRTPFEASDSLRASGSQVSPAEWPRQARNKFPASKQQTKNDETTYGMNVTHYTSPFGDLNLVYHRLLEGTKYGGYMIVVDMEEMRYRYLANDELNRDTKVLPNRQPNDQDGRKDEYLSEVGVQVGTEKAHGVLTGITS
jgi:hypothetical protein